MKPLLFLTAAALALSGCHIATDEEIAKGPQYTPANRACAAARVAIRADMHAPSETGRFGKCDTASHEDGSFAVAIAIHVPYTDDAGKQWPYALYWADAKEDPVTKEMRITNMVRNPCISGCK